MIKKICSNCLFEDVCPSKRACKYYAEADTSDEEIEEYINSGRDQYINSWWDYIKDFE